MDRDMLRRLATDWLMGSDHAMCLGYDRRGNPIVYLRGRHP